MVSEPPKCFADDLEVPLNSIPDESVLRVVINTEPLHCFKNK